MAKNQHLHSESHWLPTPTFLYRNYLYRKIIQTLPRKSYILDVGAGNGELIKTLVDKGFTFDAIDVSKEAVAIAKEKLKGIKGATVKLGSVLTYNVKDKYDAIFCFETLEHIKEDKKAIGKIYQYLKPNGLFIMSVPAHMSEWSKIDELKGHYRRYEKQELAVELKKVGFDVKFIHSYGFPILWFLRRVSKSGKYLKSKTKNLDNEAKGRESSIQQEYSAKLRLLSNNVVMYPLFKIMDLFLNTDLGFGYVAVARKPRKKIN